MNPFKIATLAFALIAPWGAVPAAAASIDYALTIPLADINADDLTPTGLLSGTLSYDDDASWGIGTFSLIGLGIPLSGTFSGNTWMLPLGGDATGILFDGWTSDDVARLFFNIVASGSTNTVVSSPVNFCVTGCAMFQSVGATMSGIEPPTGTVPSGDGASPGQVVSPVPLPPAASLFGAALLGLGMLGAGRRLAPRPHAARPRSF